MEQALVSDFEGSGDFDDLLFLFLFGRNSFTLKKNNSHCAQRRYI